MPELAHHPFRVAVVGPGSCTPERAHQAESIGRLLAEAGALVLCGGRGGVMDAVARGCRQAGGTSLGFLPQDHDEEASPEVTVPLPTGLGEARNVLVVGTAEVVIALGGGTGTLSEMALAWRLGKPVVTLDSWEVTSPDDATTPRAIRAYSPEDAVQAALALGRSHR